MLALSECVTAAFPDRCTPQGAALVSLLFVCVSFCFQALFV